MNADDDGDALRIPIVAEVATVTKRTSESGLVRISTRVEEREEPIEAALRHDDDAVQRVPIGQVVTVAPRVRMGGDVLIYPEVEETLVVEKRLVLKEELRVTRRSHVEHVERVITLRTEHADVERLAAGPPVSPTPSNILLRVNTDEAQAERVHQCLDATHPVNLDEREQQLKAEGFAAPVAPLGAATPVRSTVRS